MTQDFSLSAFRLDGKSALVAGAGRGIGLAAAKALAAAGAEVALAARSEDELERAVRSLREARGVARPVVLDVCDIEAASAAVEAHGPFDILVNNAGTNRPAAFLDVSVEDFDAVMGLNVKASFFLAQAAAKALAAANRPGSIINMSSQMGHVGAARRSVYCASKHAMEGFTKAMAIELAPLGVRVNTICPTFVETPMTAPFFADKAFREEVRSKIPLGRIGCPGDIMGALIYLASDASSLVTGTALRVDGGWTAE